MAIVKNSPAAVKTAKSAPKAEKAPVNLQEAVTARAFELWVKRGSPASTPEEQLLDWQQAEREVRKKFGLN